MFRLLFFGLDSKQRMGDASNITREIKECIESNPVYVEVGNQCCGSHVSAAPVPSAMSESDYLTQRLACLQQYSRTGVNIPACVVPDGAVPTPLTPVSPDQPIVTATQSDIRNIAYLARDNRKPGGDAYVAAKQRAIVLSTDGLNRYANVIRPQTPAPPPPAPSMKQPGVPIVQLTGCVGGVPGVNTVTFRVGRRQKGV